MERGELNLEFFKQDWRNPLWNGHLRQSISALMASWVYIYKHCQRHNGPEGGVLFTKVTSFRSYHKFFYSQILIKFHLQILDYASTSKSQPNIRISTKSKVKILTKPSFRILTENKLHNLNQGSAAKYWVNFSFKISPELQLQNLDQTLCWKSCKN